VFGTARDRRAAPGAAPGAAIQRFHHGHDLEPLDPDRVSGRRPATLGPAVVADHVTALRHDGRAATGRRPTASRPSARRSRRAGRAALGHADLGLPETWQGTVPGQPTGTLVATAWRPGRRRPAPATWASEIAGSSPVVGRRTSRTPTAASLPFTTGRCGRSGRHAADAFTSIARAGPGLAARRRDLPGLRRPLRDDGRRPVRDAGDARRVLRRDAPRRPRAPRPHRRPRRHLLWLRRSSRARRTTATTRPTTRASSRASARRPTCASWSTRPTRAARGDPRLRGQPRLVGPPGVPGRAPRPRRAEARWFTFTDWPTSTCRSSASSTIRSSTATTRVRRDHLIERPGMARPRRRRLPLRLRAGPVPCVLERLPRGDPRGATGHASPRRDRRDARPPADVRGRLDGCLDFICCRALRGRSRSGRSRRARSRPSCGATSRLRRRTSCCRRSSTTTT
jgi:hypothetical protein